MDHRRQFELRIAQIAQQPEHAVQHQVDFLGMKLQHAAQDRRAAWNGIHSAATALPLPLRAGGGSFWLRGRGFFINICARRDRVARNSARGATMSSMPWASRYSAR